MNKVAGVWKKRKLLFELTIILALSIVVYAISSIYDLLEKLAKLSEAHEGWELDELMMVSIFLVLAMSIFSVRRWQEVRKSEKELKQNIGDLQKALAEIKQLRGIIPICSGCKKIRNDAGSWQQIESYVREHSEAEFSHGICPDCMKRLYPDL